jgi:hypothetical protein
MPPRLRTFGEPFVVALPAGIRIRTRLRVSAVDQAVLCQVGEYLGRLAGHDLAERCRLGRGDVDRARRKRTLTAASSSRWAGRLPAPTTTSGSGATATCWTSGAVSSGPSGTCGRG